MCLIKCFVSATGTSCTGRLCYIAFTSNRSFTFSLLAGDGDLNFTRVGALHCTNKDCNSCFCSAALNLHAVLLALFAAALFNCACFFLPLLPLEPSHLFSQCEPAVLSHLSRRLVLLAASHVAVTLQSVAVAGMLCCTCMLCFLCCLLFAAVPVPQDAVRLFLLAC